MTLDFGSKNPPLGKGLTRGYYDSMRFITTITKSTAIDMSWKAKYFTQTLWLRHATQEQLKSASAAKEEWDKAERETPTELVKGSGTDKQLPLHIEDLNCRFVVSICS
jgi:hypothetical protein